MKRVSVDSISWIVVLTLSATAVGVPQALLVTLRLRFWCHGMLAAWPVLGTGLFPIALKCSCSLRGCLLQSCCIGCVRKLCIADLFCPVTGSRTAKAGTNHYNYSTRFLLRANPPYDLENSLLQVTCKIRRGRVVITPVSCSGGPGLYIGRGTVHSNWDCSWFFLSLSQRIAGTVS